LEGRAHVARVFAHGFERRLLLPFGQAMRIRDAAVDGSHPGVILEAFSKRDHAHTEGRPAALRRLDDDGQGARRAG